MKDFHTKQVECPFCGHKLDAQMAINGNFRPAAGDYAMCAYCTGMSVLNDDLTMRKPTAEETAAVAEAYAVIQEVMKK